MGKLKELLSIEGGAERLFDEMLRDAGTGEKMLRLALRAWGYDNLADDRMSGEASFRDMLLNRIGVEVAVDIGCNVGGYSRALLEGDSALRVYAFDPSPALTPTLRALAEEFSGRLEIIAKGVGAETGRKSFFFSESSSFLGSFAKEIEEIHYVENDRVADVEIVTLDQYFSGENAPDRIDFIKIDTEGYEEQVLKGAEKTIEAYRPKAIQIEFNWHHMFVGSTMHSIAARLPDYRLYQLLPDWIIERNPAHPFSNMFIYSNFVFLHPEALKQISQPGG
ncbi:FkbM family methyltransferase [Nisaea acidiphila]|uniref:FkbM family methyltransferase n=1 Tax=Nisaea acidiphila TaxID=1862145 RepID=A0A9J7AR21_9PROT|nr:FkbM family methyltransferase [Nisaea acidiphila]UUX49330.1 FkbM family methyltransferase [Nisaea acidiphila]